MAAEHLLEDDHSKVHRYRNGSLPDVVFAGPQDASSSSADIAPWEHASKTHNPADDLYQNLSNFTFGAANQSRTSIHDVGAADEVVGPFNDVTPRPSVAPQGSEYHPFQLHNFGQYRSGESLSRVPSHNTFGGPAGEYMSSSSTSLSSRTSGHGDPTTSGHTSLASDRAHEAMQFSSDEFDDTDAFGNQPLTFNHDQFSSGEDSDYEDDGRLHREPLHLPAYHRASRSGKVPTRGSIAHQRRGSLPMSIPQPLARDREDSLATLRRPSRSLDDDLKSFHAARAAAAAAATPGADPQSEPQSKADWRELEHRASMSSLKGKEREVEPDLGNPNDWIAEFQEQFKGGITSFPLDASVPPSSPSIPTGRRKSSIMSSWSRFAPGGSRRPSTATTGTNDDAFHKHVKRWDPFYSERRTDWVFTRERAEDGLVTRPPADRTVAPFLYPDTPTSPRTSVSMSSERTLASDSVAGSASRRKPTGTGMTRGSEEIWRCLFVGRYKVVRREITHRNHDNSKPPQQRLEVQPFADPYSKAEGRYPLTPFFVHKHSRALAFSITKFRIKDKDKERENQKDGRPSRGHSAHATNPSKMSVMLAPQRVQEQFTNTRTTNKLETHGQLGDGNMRNSDTTLLYASQVRERTKSIMEREKKEKSKKKKERDDSESATLRRHHGRDVHREPASATSSVASSSHASSSRDVFMPPPASAPVSSSTSPSLRRQISHRSLHAASAPPADSAPPVPESPLATRTPMRRIGSKHHLHSDADEDYIEDQPRRTRTPHSEAFGTMDASVIQERHRQDVQHPDGEGKSILRRIIGNSAKDGGARGNSAAKPYQPPWTMLAPRSQQEENERVVADLNTSFQGVGLLPTKVNAKSRKRGASNAKMTKPPADSVLQDVPENALYMLIPLWPTYIGVHSPPPTIPTEKRHFLLVHYIAFDNDRPSAAVEKSRKGGRSATSSTDDSTGGGTSTTMSYRDEHSILLTSFRCSARRVAYHELAGSNVLAPNEGLYVSGQIAHALEHLPQRIQQENASDVIIAVCQSRDNGIELIPEGFNRLGLCYAKKDEGGGRLKPLPSEEDQIEEDELLLTPIGRAAAEMAWLGCLALTSFGTA